MKLQYFKNSFTPPSHSDLGVEGDDSAVMVGTILKRSLTVDVYVNALHSNENPTSNFIVVLYISNIFPKASQSFA